MADFKVSGRMTVKKFQNLAKVLAVLLVSLTACKKEKKAADPVDHKLEVTAEISGDLKNYFKVTQGIIKTKDPWGEGELEADAIMVEFEKISDDLPFELNNQQPCKSNSGGEYTWCVMVDLMEESGSPFDTNLQYSDYEEMKNLITAKKGEKRWVKFSMSYDKRKTYAKAKKLIVNSKVEYEPKQKSSNSSASSTSSSEASEGDCSSFVSEYDSFASSYISLLEKYKANPNDVSLLSEYQSMASKAASMQSKVSSLSCSPADLAKISAIQMKIANAASKL